MNVSAFLFSAVPTFVLTLTVLLLSLYYVLTILKNIDEDMKYATTRIFLSPRSVAAFKRLMATLLFFTVANLAIILTLSGPFSRFLLRLNVLALFTGFASFMAVISNITTKTSRKSR